MIPVEVFGGMHVGVFGLGQSGLATIRALLTGGAQITAWDDGEPARAAAQGVGLTLAPPENWPWAELKALVLTPGVPLTHPAPHPVAAMAQEANVEIIGDVELFARTLKDLKSEAKVVAITGTNGKSTTTALTAHLLERCGFDVQMGGNIGKPVLALEPPNEHTAYVLELSSFQLDLLSDIGLDAAALLNITPDHLDRHGTIEHYSDVKAGIFDLVKPGGTAVIGVDDAHCRAICTHVCARGGYKVTPVSVGKSLSRGIYVIGGVLWDGTETQCVRVKDLNGLRGLTGSHNWQNAAAAFALVRALGGQASQVDRAFENFAGLPHRLEPVGQLGPIRFINDSKATNAEATAKALVCFNRIYWIAGGRPKSDGIAGLQSYFHRIHKAYLIGEAQTLFAETLRGRVDYVSCGDLDTAVKRALKDAQGDRAADPVVLLSPACASFDQYANFAARGEAFRDIVGGLADISKPMSEPARLGDAVAALEQKRPA